MQTKRERLKHLSTRISQEGKEGNEELIEARTRQEAAIAQKEKRLKEATRIANDSERELRRLEKLAGNNNSNDSDFKIDAIMGKLIVAMKDTIADYREQARNKAETYASEVFLKLTNAKDAFSGISIDRNFRSKIMRSKGGHMVNPSSGMVSMMTLSVIDALRQVSGIDAPVFLDTPGRSLDEKHKRELLEYFWKSEGHQFLIFAHSGEYSVKETVEKYSDKLAKAWTLTFPSDHKSCFIPKCQSEDVEFDVFEKTNTCNKCNNKWDIKSKMPMILEVKLND